MTALGVAGDNFAAMAAAQAILCGLFLVAASVLKLGALANFLSRPILVGFVGGLALEVLLSQVAKMLGIRLPSDEEFFPRLFTLVTHLGQTSVASAAMAAAALAVLLAGRRFAPAAPAALIVLVLTTVATVVFKLESAGIAVLGEVPAGLPRMAVPSLALEQWLSLVPSALALALVATAEGVLISQSYGAKRGYRVSPDRDLLAFGAANVTAGFSMSFAVGSSTSRTAAMDQVGSRTQLPSLVLAAGTLLLLLVGTALLEPIPMPAIGAVVAVAVLKLLGIDELATIARQSRSELAVALVCLLGVLVLGPISGLLLAFVLSLINLVRRAGSPAVEFLEEPMDPGASVTTATGGDFAVTDGIVVLRFSAPIFFGNASALTSAVERVVDGHGNDLRAVVLDAEGITDVDVTGAEAFHGIRASLTDRGIALTVARLRPGLRQRFERFGLLEGIELFPTNREALAALRSAPLRNRRLIHSG
ncbi:SulP family inorganic anion transporter [Tessaracoccus coleopterorum]|uniref:SulP family inorganic anion transporter n=1 Tax=Tessaracoccus coleopterorum TaxID=2714950 RepID=UPI0018D3EF8A|nr:SulP family inorganic anion transporter [Tessaracoccus coleopterorum]